MFITFDTYTRHRWRPEFSKTRASWDIKVTVGKDTDGDHSELGLFIAARFANLAVSSRDSQLQIADQFFSSRLV